MLVRYDKEHKKNGDFIFNEKSNKLTFHHSNVIEYKPKNSKKKSKSNIGILDLNTNLYPKKAKCDLYFNYNGYISTNNKIRFDYNREFSLSSSNYLLLPMIPLVFKYRRQATNAYELRVNKILSYPFYTSCISLDIISNALRLYMSLTNRLVEWKFGCGRNHVKYDVKVNSRLVGLEFRYKMLDNDLVRSSFALASNTKYYTLTMLADYKAMNYSTKLTKSINDNFKIGSEYAYRNGRKDFILGYCLNGVKNIYSWFFSTNLNTGFSVSRCFGKGKNAEIGLVLDLAKRNISRYMLQIRFDNPSFT